MDGWVVGLGGVGGWVVYLYVQPEVGRESAGGETEEGGEGEEEAEGEGLERWVGGWVVE